jgi:hypothetical protein
MTDTEPRAVPPFIHKKWRTWRNSSMGWKAAHYFAGFLSAALAAGIAINTKSSFLSTTEAFVIASVAAGLSFLVTTMGAQERAKGLELAAWELEEAMALYRSDPSIPSSELGKAQARGVDILKGGRSQGSQASENAKKT